ncbi:MAG: hypothetical protein CVU38_09790 [Chloroflexi bacterium HGW-Chloroflexi-1]|nr:MAG: hypothetical protein CVU38_09790 [Chloroflexi bacterium HGW-Chloroflexi-1]
MAASRGARQLGPSGAAVGRIVQRVHDAHQSTALLLEATMILARANTWERAAAQIEGVYQRIY